jgi:hypothetical protein
MRAAASGDAIDPCQKLLCVATATDAAPGGARSDRERVLGACVVATTCAPGRRAVRAIR